MASISTSTSLGNFAAWIHVLAGFGAGISWSSISCILFHITPWDTRLFVNLIHRSKVVHVFQIDVDFDYFVPRRTCGLQYITEIVDALSLYQKSSICCVQWTAKRNTVCSRMPPTTKLPFLSTGVWPLKKISPGTFVAWAIQIVDQLRSDWYRSPFASTYRECAWK